MELTYTKCGDYLIPDLVLADTKEYHIRKYGRLRRACLKNIGPFCIPISLSPKSCFPAWKSTSPAGSGWKSLKNHDAAKGVTGSPQPAPSAAEGGGAAPHPPHQPRGRPWGRAGLLWGGRKQFFFRSRGKGGVFPEEAVVPPPPETPKAVKPVQR